MQIRWLGWAGVEVEARGQRIVIDPLQDPLAVFGWLGEQANAVPLPQVVAPQPGANAGLLTHLHREHADAAALTAALALGATVYEPLDYGGAGAERLALLQADHELAAAGLRRQTAEAWTTTRAGAFMLTALPAVDGSGDPQASWLIEAEGRRVLHLGDTMWHAWWWRIAERYGTPDVVLAPINGPRLSLADEVDAVAETSNLATTAILRAFAPRLAPGGRLIVVASALGTLDHLDPRVAGRFATAATQDLEAVDALVDDWARAVHDRRAEQDGYGSWLNIPSKVAQVAAVRALARERRATDPAENRLLMALCPGLIDTDASRPWFEDMSQAQTRAQAAAWPVELALASNFDSAYYGELVQFGKILPWKTGTPVARAATT